MDGERTSTAWAEAVSAAMVLIDDLRLQEQLQISPAQFYRRMAAFVRQAVTLLNRPPELYDALTRGMAEPVYDDFEWESTEESAEGPVVVQTGKAGFQLCSVVWLEAGPGGEIEYVPYGDAAYDPESGDVTFGVQEEAGRKYLLDFYTDGSFSPELTLRQTRLLALAVAVVWNQRFSNNWINIQPKLRDESFEVVNEANYQEKNSQRFLRVVQDFTDELKKYEQDVAYVNVARRRGAGRGMALI